MKNTIISVAVAALLSASLAMPASAGVFGSEDSGAAIEKGTARVMNRVMKGTILQVSDAKIEESAGVRGTGATAGMAAGAAIGAGPNGRGGLFGSVIGAVVGGIGGAVASASMGKQTAQDLIIMLDNNGEPVAITQAVDEKVGAFKEGDAVLVIYKGDSARVIRNKAATPQGAASQGVVSSETPAPVQAVTPLLN